MTMHWHPHHGIGYGAFIGILFLTAAATSHDQDPMRWVGAMAGVWVFLMLPLASGFCKRCP